MESFHRIACGESDSDDVDLRAAETLSNTLKQMQMVWAFVGATDEDAQRPFAAVVIEKIRNSHERAASALEHKTVENQCMRRSLARQRKVIKSLNAALQKRAPKLRLPTGILRATG